MSKSTNITYASLLAPTLQQPNEVCLTLYFIQEGSRQQVDKIRLYVQQNQSTWESITDFDIFIGKKKVQMGYKATQLTQDQDIESLYILEISTALSENAYAVQLILNLNQNAEKAWARASAWLQEKLQPLFSSPPKSLLGYTVVYRANIPRYTPLEKISFDGVFINNLQWIHTSEVIGPSQVLAQQYFPEQGWLGLIAYPSEPKGGLVYIALGFEGSTIQDIAHTAYASYYAQLPSIDMFFHKGFRQGMELVRRYPTYEKAKITPLKNAITTLLKSNPKNRKILEQDLEAMAKQIAIHTDFYWNIERLELSLDQQIKGIERLFTHTEIPPIAKYHLRTLHAYQDETQAYVRKNKSVLETARLTLSMVEAQENKRISSLQEYFNKIVAFVGIFLAADQILDEEFAKEVLGVLHYCPSATTFPYWVIFGTRLTVAIALSAVTFGGFSLFKLLKNRK